MKSAILMASALLAAPLAASAQTAPAAPAATAKPTVGAAIFDQTGAPIGTVSGVTDQAIEIDTGANKVAVPPASVGTNAKGLYMAMTKAQIDAAAVQAKSQAAAALTPGAAVKSADGQALGTIKTADAQFVTVTTADGKDVRLPASGFAAGPDGVKVGFTAAQFQQALAGAAPAPTSGGAGGASADAASSAASGSVAGATPSPGTTPEQTASKPKPAGQ